MPDLHTEAPHLARPPLSLPIRPPRAPSRAAGVVPRGRMPSVIDRARPRRARNAKKETRLCYARLPSDLTSYRFTEDYVRRLTAGDPSVETHFSAYFGELLFLKLRHRLRSAQAIDDIRQETFLRIFKALREKGGVEHPERLGAFVNSVCNNVLFEFFRSQTRYASLSEQDSEPEDCRIDIEARLVSDERKRAVEGVLAQLSTLDRQILKMLFFDETDKEEICRTMGVGRNYLRVLVYRARLRFKAVFEKVNAAAR